MNTKSANPRYTPEEIHYMDGGMVTLGVSDLRCLVANVLNRVPKDVVDRLFEECLILVPEPAEQGCYIPKTLVAGKHIIMFPFDIFGWPEEQQTHVVLHETAHFALGHRSPVEDVTLDYDRQEEEAEALVDRWMERKPDKRQGWIR